MQRTIESLFKDSSSSSKTQNFSDIYEGIREDLHPQIKVKYTRQSTREGDCTNDGKIEKESVQLKIENKKRKYALAQFHLELGQSDFLLHTCRICGIKYAKGDETDEKLHNTFHKNFTLGIPFKGWRHEKVIDLGLLGNDRIILIRSFDFPVYKKKVEEVVKMMEVELGDGWIINEHCKVYLFISSQRVAGCAFVESKSTAHKILSDSVQNIADGASVKEITTESKTLQFGGICFQREVSRSGSNHRIMAAMDSSLLGSIVCEEEARSASCGIRAIWVSPSNRRKHIATHLVDAVRFGRFGRQVKSFHDKLAICREVVAEVDTGFFRPSFINRKNFSTDYVLERSQLAFSVPTSAGKALVEKYTGVRSFLVYKS